MLIMFLQYAYTHISPNASPFEYVCASLLSESHLAVIRLTDHFAKQLIKVLKRFQFTQSGMLRKLQ